MSQAENLDERQTQVLGAADSCLRAAVRPCCQFCSQPDGRHQVQLQMTMLRVCSRTLGETTMYVDGSSNSYQHCVRPRGQLNL